jgi:hypothetical protein
MRRIDHLTRCSLQKVRVEARPIAPFSLDNLPLRVGELEDVQCQVYRNGPGIHRWTHLDNLLAENAISAWHIDVVFPCRRCPSQHLSRWRTFLFPRIHRFTRGNSGVTATNVQCRSNRPGCDSLNSPKLTGFSCSLAVSRAQVGVRCVVCERMRPCAFSVEVPSAGATAEAATETPSAGDGSRTCLDRQA